MSINPIEIKKQMKEFRAETLEFFRTSDINAPELIKRLGDNVHNNVEALAQEHLGDFQDQIAMVYTGANGREEVCPYSDLDVFLLVEDQLFDGKKIPEDQDKFAEAFQGFYYGLMDAGFDISSVVLRTPEHCAEDIAADQETWTQLIDRRKGWGSDELYEKLAERFTQIDDETRKTFMQSKFDEYDERLSRHDKEEHATAERGVTSMGRFTVIEPNVKNGYGGLRGYQTAHWVSEEQCGIGGCDLVGRGIVTEEDSNAAKEAYDFLLAIRCHTHDIAGKEDDTLYSHIQPELAKRMGYDDVTPFMRDYFSATREIAHYAKMVCSDVADQIGIKPPGSSTDEQIQLRSKDLSDPMQILEAFKEHVETGNSLHHITMQEIRKNLDMITDEFIQDPQANRVMLDILSHENAERTLRRMNTLGVLPKFIPEFEKTQALIQFDPHHAYTVDDHTIVGIGNITALARQEHVDLSPVASRLAQDLTKEDREVIAVALLLHDVHKGDNADNMKAYNRDLVESVGARLGLEGEALEQAQWLAENHLLFKHTARYQDIEDPETIHNFVSNIPDVKHLNLLRVMTMADTLALGPGRLSPHAAFRAESVYEKSHQVMNGLSGQYNRKSFQLPDDYEDGAPYISIVPNDAVKADILTVITEDKPYLIENIMATLETYSSSVLNARVSTIPDDSGRVANTFVIQTGAARGMHSDRQREALHKALTEATQKDERIELEPISAKQDTARNPQNMVFSVEPDIEFSNALSDSNTIVKVTARDRPHLLHSISTVFNDMDIRLEHASITTQGHKAVNVFRVHTADGGQISTNDQEDLYDAIMEQISEEEETLEETLEIT